MQIKYLHLKIIVVDEVSMLELKTFCDLNLQLQLIFENKEDFGGVSLLFCGDLLQLPAVGSSIYATDFKEASYANFRGNLWH